MKRALRPWLPILPLAVPIAVGLVLAAAGCDEAGDTGTADATTDESALAAADVSPVRSIRHQRDRQRRHRDRHRDDRQTDAFRTIDGSGNNPINESIGAAFIRLRRIMPEAYGDGVSSLAGADRPNPRAISNLVCAQTGSVPNPYGASDYLWQWGQFLDHDIDLTDGADPAEPAPVLVPLGDAYFDPFGTGEVEINLNRSVWDPATGTDAGNPRQQLNEITAWIDASNVYGSDEERARALRTLDGSGRLKVSDGDLLPFNDAGLPNAGGTSPALFLAGDVRANEQTGLTAMHTLFVREHNRIAGRLRDRHPDWSGDEIYQHARRYLGALMQVITYYEYLPALLGPDPLPPYNGYDSSIDAGILNLFSTAAYRYGHSALSATLLRLDADGNEIADGHLALRDAFFNPARIHSEGGIEPVLRGLAAQRCQAVDVLIIDDVRNFLFGPPGAGGFDLATLNIQRGRDHGLPDYNTVRVWLGLDAVADFSDITTDTALQAKLQAAYGSVERIDPWVGGLAEDPLPRSHVGQLMTRVLRRQFRALRDGDRFWYARTLPDDLRREVEATRLSDVIRRNTSITNEIADDVFHVPAG